MKSRQDEEKKCGFGISREGAKIPLATIPTINDAINGRFAHELTRAIVMNYRCNAARCRDSPAIPSPLLRFTPRLLSCATRVHGRAIDIYYLCESRARRARRIGFLAFEERTPDPTLLSSWSLSVKWRKRRFPEKKSDGRSAAEIRHDKYNRGSWRAEKCVALCVAE